MIEIVKNTKNRNLKNADIVRIDIPTIYAEQNLSIARAILIQLAPTLFCSSSARLFSSSSSRARVSLEMASSILEDNNTKISNNCYKHNFTTFQKFQSCVQYQDLPFSSSTPFPVASSVHDASCRTTDPWHLVWISTNQPS